MDEQNEIKKLKSEGYDNVWVYEAGPNEVDQEHSHDYDTKLVILARAINITSVLGGAVTNMKYKTGSEVVIPRKKYTLQKSLLRVVDILLPKDTNLIPKSIDFARTVLAKY